eukprot:CAMPEP_0167789406 /NCGR_PEP_ID=MMETSP0111_2-20121227/10665_1 /TAXON_ID=91324 /ORGANISM="Lotharella globosa, Strain CCCM811" /LENGTH=560 /DNA_ID=CAMNT_0007681565 /DNA_START=167 /DNA_END=1846 /DNA_ORIENTATION=-
MASSHIPQLRVWRYIVTLAIACISLTILWMMREQDQWKDLMQSRLTPMLGKSGVVKELLRECKLARATKDFCRGVNTPAFVHFLETLHPKASLRKWHSDCARAVQDKNMHDEPVCVAAAYMLVPFDVEGTREANCTMVNTKSRAPASVNNIIPTERSSQQYKLDVVTVESNPSENHHCSLIRTAGARGLGVHVLGSKLRRKISPAEKTMMVQEHLSSIRPEDKNRTIVLFVDSRDVLIQGSEEEIIREFLRMDTGMVFNAERDCFPFKFWPLNMGMYEPGNRRNEEFTHHHICRNLFPKGEGITSSRYLNSGAFIAYADVLDNLYRDVKAIPKWFLNTWPGTDQGLFTQFYLSGRYRIQVDVCRRLFLSTHAPEYRKPDNPDRSVWESYGYGPYRPQWNVIYAAKKASSHATMHRDDSEVVDSGNVWVEKITNRRPLVLHFNGDAKRFWDDKMDANHIRPKECPSMLPYYEEFILDDWAETMGQREDTRMCFLPQQEQMLRNCSFDKSTKSALFDPEHASVALFSVLGNTRAYTVLPDRLHIVFAQAAFAATKEVGEREW